ncbi:MAG: hypothetical protein QG650_585 [Patescibacteria group bacterium]|nr:hypothetical protein [Patescibacteria group bacterium]
MGGESASAAMELGLRQMRAGMGTFKNSMQRVKDQIARFQSQNGEASPALEDAMKKVDEAVAIVESATTLEEAQKGFDLVEEITSVIDKELPRLAMSAQLPNLFRRADTEMVRLKAAVLPPVGASGSVDLAPAREAFKTRVADLESALAKARELSKAEPLAGIDALQANFFDRLHETWMAYAGLQATANLDRAALMAVQVVRSSGRIAESATGTGAERLREVHAQMKETAEKFLTAVKSGSNEEGMSEELMSLIASLMAGKDAFDAALADAGMAHRIGNPFGNFVPAGAPNANSFGNFGQDAIGGQIAARPAEDAYAAVVKKMGPKLDKALSGLESSLDRRFGENQDGKVAAIDKILAKLDKVLSGAKLSGKNRAVYSSLQDKLTVLRDQYASGDLGINDVMQSDINELLEVD